MKVKVQNLTNGEIFEIPDVSKAMLVKKFKTKVKEATGIETKAQNLMFGGKIFNDDCDLCDYKLEDGYKILMQVRKPLEALPTKSNGSKPSSPEKATVEPEPEKTNAKEVEAKLSREEEKARLIAIGCSELAAEMDKEPDPAEQLCKKCKKDPERKCKECGCTVCGSREDAGKQLFCEECEFSTHMYCLDPPLEEIPDDDWYCPLCKNDESEIVGKGEMVKYGKARAKQPSRMKMCKRDWGKGMATAGRTKTNTSIVKGHFGPIPGIDVGMSWQYRIQVSEVGIHAPPVAGISGTKEKGCNSLVLAGGYEDDTDEGFEFSYTGSGGRDLSGNKRTAEQSFDQTLTKSNAAIAVSCNAYFDDENGAESKDWKKGKPIRVCRSFKFKKHSKFAPDVGVRYDGIYKVVKYYPEKGKAGFKMWKYLLRRDDESPVPWDANAKKYKCIMHVKDGVPPKDGENTSNEPVEDEAYEIEKNLLKLIKADSKNEKIWDDLKGLKLRKDLWFEKVQEEFNCFCCYELILFPVTLPCNHNCCKKCLLKSMAEGHKECWMCRYKLEEDPEPEKKAEDEAMPEVKTEDDTAVVVKTEDAEAKPEDEAAADKPKPPKKFNVDEHFNNELHAIMKYLFPGLMPNEQEVVKNTENFFKKKSSGKRKRVENENSTNDQETDVATVNGTSNEASSSNAATNEDDDNTGTGSKTKTAPKPKKVASIFENAKRSKRAKKDVDYAELN